jgi:uncharacterized membrane protein
MPNATGTRVRSYLDELERALRDLPKDRRQEIVRDIRGHIDVALADLGEPSDADIEQVLDGLGTPQEIAEAAFAEQPPARPRMAVRDVATVILLLIGGIVLPFFGWVIGLVLLWSSTAWRTRDKVIGSLIVPGGLFGSLIVFGLALFATSSSSTCISTAATVKAHHLTCTTGGTGSLGVVVAATLLVVSAIGPFFTMVWLIRTAHRES